MVLAPNLGEGYQIGCGVCAIIPGNRTHILDLKPLQRGICGGRPSPSPEGCRTGLAVLTESSMPDVLLLILLPSRGK